MAPDQRVFFGSSHAEGAMRKEGSDVLSGSTPVQQGATESSPLVEVQPTKTAENLAFATDGRLLEV